MKIKTVSTIAAVAFASLLAIGAKATPITLDLTSSQFLGYVTPGTPEGDSDRAAYINELITLAPNASGSVESSTATRSANPFSGLTSANSLTDVTPSTMNFGTGYEYLFAFYGNGNDLNLPGKQVALVWVVSGLSGDFTIDSKALSHWDLIDPTSTSNSRTVPDGGSTVALLGAALTGIGLLRNKISSRR
jgi:hypothetical protein